MVTQSDDARTLNALVEDVVHLENGGQVVADVFIQHEDFAAIAGSDGPNGLQVA